MSSERTQQRAQQGLKSPGLRRLHLGRCARHHLAAFGPHGFELGGASQAPLS